jgi:hypothetical protein|nr:hypothetical protein [Spirochaetaceae bacterium]
VVMPYMYTHANWHESQLTDENGNLGINGASAKNIDNYTHMGQNLGVTLSPNSDRINLSIQLEPVDRLNIELKGNYIRHGNASVRGSTNLVDPDEEYGGDDVDLDGDPSTAPDVGTVPNDGSIFDSGIDEDGELYFQRENRFLEQDVIEQVLQFGFRLETELPMPLMDAKEYYKLLFYCDYTWEMMWNSGRESTYGYQPVEGNDESNYYLSIGFDFIF